MITVEELIIQSLYYRLVVTRVRHCPTTQADDSRPATSEELPPNAGTSSCDAECVRDDIDASQQESSSPGPLCPRRDSPSPEPLRPRTEYPSPGPLYTRREFPSLGPLCPRTEALPTDVSVSIYAPLQTVLDTGEVVLCQRTVVSCETQTTWSSCTNDGASPSMPLQMELMGAVPMCLGSQPVVDISGGDDMTVVQLQHVGDNERRIVAMYKEHGDSQQKTSIGGEELLSAGERLESVTASPLLHQVSSGSSGYRSSDHDFDSGIWDVVSGRESRNNAMDLTRQCRQAAGGWPLESTPMSPSLRSAGEKEEEGSVTELNSVNVQAKRKLTYKVFNVNDVAQHIPTEPAQDTSIVWQSPETHHSLTRAVHSDHVTSIKYETEPAVLRPSSVDSFGGVCNGMVDDTAFFGLLPSDVHREVAKVGTVTNDVHGHREFPSIDFASKHQPIQNDAIATLLSAMENDDVDCGGGRQLRCRSEETLSRRQTKMADSPRGSDDACSLFSYDMSFDSKFETSTESLAAAMASEAAEEYARYPDWMGELPASFQTLPLTQLALPGSHISLAIERHMHIDMEFSKCDYDMADFLRKLPNMSVFNDFRSLMKRVWKAWMPKQWLSVGEQLEAGVRYFDMKICTYRSAFYGEHGLYSRCLAKYLREMRSFLDTHPQEVVILHFQQLIQMEVSEKRRLVTSLFQMFGAKMAKSVVLGRTSLADMRRHRKQVIVLFNHADLGDLSNHIFAGLIWNDHLVEGTPATSRSVSELVSQLDAMYSGEIGSRDLGRLHVTRAVLCPDMSMVFGEFQHRSMRELTSRETMPALARWLQRRPLLNVVAVDFSGIGDLVGIIIRLNHSKKTVTDV